MSRYFYLGTALALVTLFLINIQQCAAVDITKCWSGWAKGKDIMKTMRYTNETNCPENTKYCAKWYLMTGDEYFVGYTCGGTEKVSNKNCDKNIQTIEDLITSDEVMAPCQKGARDQGCPSGSNINVTTCYCDSMNLCNFARTNQPRNVAFISIIFFLFFFKSF